MGHQDSMEEDVEILDSLWEEKTTFNDKRQQLQFKANNNDLEAQGQDCLQPRVFLLNPIVVILMDVRRNS